MENRAQESTTRLSSRGQIVIPEEIRKRLELREGTQFVVMGKGDTIILKAIKAPSMKDFDRIVADVRRQVRERGITRKDVAKVIEEARAKR